MATSLPPFLLAADMSPQRSPPRAEPIDDDDGTRTIRPNTPSDDDYWGAFGEPPVSPVTAHTSFAQHSASRVRAALIRRIQAMTERRQSGRSRLTTSTLTIKQTLTRPPLDQECSAFSHFVQDMMRTWRSEIQSVELVEVIRRTPSLPTGMLPVEELCHVEWVFSVVEDIGVGTSEDEAGL